MGNRLTNYDDDDNDADVVQWSVCKREYFEPYSLAVVDRVSLLLRKFWKRVGSCRAD